MNKGRKLNKIRFEKNIKASLFIDDILYVEKPNLLKEGTISGKFSKISGYKVSV